MNNVNYLFSPGVENLDGLLADYWLRFVPLSFIYVKCGCEQRTYHPTDFNRSHTRHLNLFGASRTPHVC